MWNSPAANTAFAPASSANVMNLTPPGPLVVTGVCGGRTRLASTGSRSRIPKAGRVPKTAAPLCQVVLHDLRVRHSSELLEIPPQVLCEAARTRRSYAPSAKVPAPARVDRQALCAGAWSHPACSGRGHAWSGVGCQAAHKHLLAPGLVLLGHGLFDVNLRSRCAARQQPASGCSDGLPPNTAQGGPGQPRTSDSCAQLMRSSIRCSCPRTGKSNHTWPRKRALCNLASARRRHAPSGYSSDVLRHTHFAHPPQI